MRLLNVKTLKTYQFLNKKTRPPYAILSHTWLADNEEVTFEDLLGYHDAVARAQTVLADSIASRPGFKKIQDCCNLAARSHNLEWAWVDTCCIDKRSSAELSEAINSMFNWYQDATICYAFLQDVTGSEHDPSFRDSKWFTRGWTLQELIAPKRVSFYDQRWQLIGAMDEDSQLCDIVSSITLIPVAFLKGAPLTDACVAKKMSWASKRQTTRLEDVAYCLLGIFDVNMPLLYGEGDRAFIRLQEQIISQTQDDSILAWGSVNLYSPKDLIYCPSHLSLEEFINPPSYNTIYSRARQTIPDMGALATSPADFEDGGDFEIGSDLVRSHDNSGLQMTTDSFRLSVELQYYHKLVFCKLSCITRRYPSQNILLLLFPLSSSRYVRLGRVLFCNLPLKRLRCGRIITIAKNPTPSIVGITGSRHQPDDPDLRFILLDFPRGYTGSTEYAHPGFRVEMNTHQLGQNSLRIVYSPERSNMGGLQRVLVLLMLCAPFLILPLFSIVITTLIAKNKLGVSSQALLFIQGLSIAYFAALRPLCFPAIFRRSTRPWFFMTGTGADLRMNRCAVRACIRITRQDPRFPSSGAEQMMVIIAYLPLTTVRTRILGLVDVLKPELTCHLATVPIGGFGEESVHPTVLDQWLRVYNNLEAGGKTYAVHSREFITDNRKENSPNVIFRINVEEP
ncbi:heterokaryon incompatibility protein-domain-containing protein [Xylariaceae sp. FL1651]|nr:heterokaryon incompatibility protein-domain-containing protein [Xylariaceae sp. FL1651]